MRNKLEKLEQYIFEGLSGNSSKKFQLDKIYQNFKTEIQEEIFNLNSIEQAKLFIQNHYYSLNYFLNLINTKYDYTTNEDKIVQYIEQMQNYLIVRHYKYLEEESTVPIHWQRYINKAYRLKVTQFILELTKENISNELIDILREQYNDIIINKINFKQLEYFRKVFTTLNEGGLDEELIIKKLYTLNYNSKEFIKYQIDKIKAENNKQSGQQGKINYLKEIRKYYSELPTSKTLFYDEDNPNIKEKLFQWIDDEINIIQSIKKENITNIETPIKLETDLSVEQLSLLFRTLYDNKIIKAEQQKDIFQFISKSFKTKNTENISSTSIQSKYYTNNPQTKNALKRMLIEAINTIQQY